MESSRLMNEINLKKILKEYGYSDIAIKNILLSTQTSDLGYLRLEVATTLALEKKMLVS